MKLFVQYYTSIFLEKYSVSEIDTKNGNCDLKIKIHSVFQENEKKKRKILKIMK